MQLSAEQILNPTPGIFACLQVEDEIREFVSGAYPGAKVDCEVKRLDDRNGHWVALALGFMPAKSAISDDTAPTRAGFLECAEGDTEIQAMMRLEAKVLERVVPERSSRETVQIERVDSERCPRRTLRD